MRELDDAVIRRYLLGLLPEPEVEAVEEAYFGQAEVFDRVRGAEDDLIDDYVAGRLERSEAAAFEARYLSSPPLRQRVEAARALRLARPPAGASAPVTRRVRWLGPLAIAAGIAIAVVAAVAILRSRAPQPTAAPPSMAGAPTPAPGAGETGVPSPGPSGSPSATPLAGRRVLLALSPTLLRGEAGGAAEARIPPRTDFVVLRLQLQPSEVRDATPLQASVETVEGTRVWNGAAQQVPERENLAAEVAVPAARLPAGDYLVTLDAGTETLHRYFFRVLAR
jgi:hypothetical protein